MSRQEVAGCVVAFPDSPEAMRESIRLLHGVGFADDQIVIVTRDEVSHLRPDMGDRMLQWGKHGAVLGMLFGLLLVGPALFESSMRLSPEWPEILVLALVEGAIVGGGSAAIAASVQTFVNWLGQRNAPPPVEDLGVVVVRGRRPDLSQAIKALHGKGVRVHRFQ